MRLRITLDLPCTQKRRFIDKLFDIICGGDEWSGVRSEKVENLLVDWYWCAEYFQLSTTTLNKIAESIYFRFFY